METDSQNAINAVNSSLPAYNTAIAAREAAFKPLSQLITRVMNSLKASNTGSEIVDKAVTLVRKLQGRRATTKLTEEEKQELIAQGKEVNEPLARRSQISSSQLSFDNRIDNLDKLINLLGSIPEYKPNETDLQVVSLKSLLKDLKTKNDAANEAAIPLSNARIARNNILYNNGSGLVDIALNVKAYVKSLFGVKSPQYRQISGLEFKRYKI
ncbi:MAG: hypothetical protein JXB17_13730 [Bacteroidales bacterium]|nr:hypothetical protein [Bacteroidales bacterium]